MSVPNAAHADAISDGINASSSLPVLSHSTSTIISPGTDSNGQLMPQELFRARLATYTTKAPLLATCIELNITGVKTANLERLRSKILGYWYPDRPEGSLSSVPKRHKSLAVDQHSSTSRSTSSQSTSSRKRQYDEINPENEGSEYVDVDDETLLNDMAAPGVQLYNGDDENELLGYGEDGLEDEDEADEEVDNFERHKKRVRLQADNAWQNNRREGGKRAQMQVVKSWNKFLDEALFKGEVKDRIVDEHSLLSFVMWTYARPKLNRRGIEQPGTFVGASQIKKMFFGALRIRKTQEAANPLLQSRRPAVTNRVYDCVKTQMDLALKRVRDGLVPNEDMPDIVANTALEKLSDQHMRRITIAFLEHREMRIAVDGHLAWTAQNASGKRGDDIRSLRIRELQPYEFVHPNKVTKIDALLGLQGEEKYKAKGMKSVHQPVISTWIPHQDPLWDAIGSILRKLHWLFDVYKIDTKKEIDWSVNRSWGQIRMLFGSNPDHTYHSSNLYNIYCQAFEKSGFKSRIKQHLPRKILGYRQEDMGVSSTSTARLGWYNRDVYHTNYAPQIPKDAVLAAHGWKEHETCDAVYRRVSVPVQFLSLVVPRADEILAQVRQAQESQDNLRGCENFWQMIIDYRTIFFQTSAAIYEIIPNSAIFRLPALCNPDVINWMKNGFPSEFAALKAQAGSPVDLTRIQDRMMREALEQNRASIHDFQMETMQHLAMLARRTAILSPTKFSNELYHSRRDTLHTTMLDPSHSIMFVSLHTTFISSHPTTFYSLYSATTNALCTATFDSIMFDSATFDAATFNSAAFDSATFNAATFNFLHFVIRTSPLSSPSSSTEMNVHVGVYHSPDRSMRAFVDPTTTSTKSSVDLVLPPIQAFYAPGVLPTAWPPVFGTKALSWDQVFELIQQFDALWEVWRPNSTLDKYTDIASVWRCYNSGEKTIDTRTNTETGIKPPLRLVEQRFGARWRPGAKARKQWQRFLAIPDYINTELTKGRNEKAVIEELEQMRTIAGSKRKCGLNQLAIRLEEQRKSIQAPPPPPRADTTTPTTSAMPSITSNGKKPRRPAVNRRPKPKNS
ncbi:hypothetical protein FB446DRAFT_821118 [Lentinula raphanica]|nr:hypothetical protein FB446DRAFT_821118 [Lentinula raphanica]